MAYAGYEHSVEEEAIVNVLHVQASFLRTVEMEAQDVMGSISGSSSTTVEQ